MTEYGSLVEREIQRLGPAPFSLDDLHRRRERKQRNQRIAAGAVALAVIGAMAGGLGWALTRGTDGAGVVRPAGEGAQARTFAPEDLEAIVLRPEDAPGDTEHKQTTTGQTALSGPLASASSLTVLDLTGSGTGFVDAREAEFLEGALGDPDAVFFGSAVVLYEDANGAARAYRLLVDDFAGRGEGATRESVPSLGEEAAAVRAVGLLGDPPTPDAVYIWRTGNLVLIAAGGPSVEDEVRSIAEEMDLRAAARA